MMWGEPSSFLHVIERLQGRRSLGWTAAISRCLVLIVVSGQEKPFDDHKTFVQPKAASNRIGVRKIDIYIC